MTRLMEIGVCGLGLAVLATACSDDDAGGTGEVRVFVEAEESIPDGLEPGTGLENIVDGWTVVYDRFIIAIGNVQASASAGGQTLAEPTIHVVDLTSTPETGFALAEFHDVAAIRFDRVSYDNPVATSTAQRADNVSQSDFDMMVSGAYSLFMSGHLENASGESCLPGTAADCVPAARIDFAWGISAPTSYTMCGPEEGDTGFAVASGGTTQATFTVHGDHQFFNNFVEGVEITMRRAQWIADCDLDRDGETTMDELGMVQAADVFDTEQYSLSGSPSPIATARDFLIAQQHTFGHFQGEGECEPVVLR